MKIVGESSCNSMRTPFATGDVPKSAKQPSQRRLDEEAVSRMDDEGGAPDAALKPPGAAKKAGPGS